MAKMMTKGQLADYAGALDNTINKETFLRYLRKNAQFLKDNFGVEPTQRMLPPKAVAWICEQYDIELPPNLK